MSGLRLLIRIIFFLQKTYHLGVDQGVAWLRADSKILVMAASNVLLFIHETYHSLKCHIKTVHIMSNSK